MAIQSYKGNTERIRGGNVAYFDRRYFESQVKNQVPESLKLFSQNPFNWEVNDLVTLIEKSGMQIRGTRAKFITICVHDTPKGRIEYDLNGGEYKKVSSLPLIWQDCDLSVEMKDLDSPTLPITRIKYESNPKNSFASYLNVVIAESLTKPRDWNDAEQVKLYHRTLKDLFSGAPSKDTLNLFNVKQRVSK